MIHEPKAHVCIVDGDAAVRNGLTELLRMEGYSTSSFDSGAKYLRDLQRRRRSFVLCCVELPDFDGRALIASARQQGGQDEFVLLANNHRSHANGSWTATGLRGVLRKPIGDKSLLLQLLQPDSL